MKEYYNVLYAVYTSCLLSIVLTKFDKIYVPLEVNGVHTRWSYQKLNGPHLKANVGPKALSYVGLSLRNNLSNTLKISTSLNAFKNNIKQHYFNELVRKVF